jgi:hypothetical protein
MKMAGTLQDLRAHVAGGGVLGEEQLAELDYDAVLEQRDSPPFDKEWARVDGVVKSTRRDGRLNEAIWKQIDEIRHAAFVKMGEFAGTHEICNYVSDDFGLIATALALGSEDSWLNALWLAYRKGQIPCGVLSPVQGKLASFI